MAAVKRGVVKWFNTEKGYGFILNDQGTDVFVHYRAIQQDGFKNLAEGQVVDYIETQSEKGLNAAEVSVVSGPGKRAEPAPPPGAQGHLFGYNGQAEHFPDDNFGNR